MVPDGRMDGQTHARTDDAKTISLRLRRGIIRKAATWYKIFCPQTPPPDPKGGVKIQLFQNMVMLHIKLRGSSNK